MTIPSTTEANIREPLIFHKNSMTIHLNLRSERLREIQRESNSGERTPISRFSIVINLNNLTKNATNSTDNLFVIVSSREFGEANPGNSFLNFVAMGTEGGGPGLNGEVVSEDDSRPIRKSILEVKGVFESNQETTLI